MRRTFIIIGAVVLVLAIVIGVMLIVRQRGGGEDVSNVRRADVLAGDILITVSAAGTVEPEQVASLYFPADVLSVVDVVRVDIGDRVRQREPLARIDAQGLDIAREQAEIEFDIQALRNEQFLEPPSETDLAAARAEVSAASARYQDASTIDAELLEIERLEAAQSVQGYRAADISYKGVLDQSTNAIEGNAHAGAGIAWVSSEISRLEFEQMLAGPRPEDVAVAGAEVALGSAELRQAEAAPTELEVERTEIQLQRAQIALDKAMESAAEATIRAPFNGVVALMNLKAGTPAPVEQPAIVVVDDSVFHIDVEVDEIDISEIEVGQGVLVELDALPDRRLTGTVISVAPAASEDAGGVVSYIARVDLDPTDAPLLSGMTATVDIIVKQQEGVLRIPNWAIRIDRRTGETFVNVSDPDGGLVEIEIELGLRGDSYSQVLTGLDEGQEVLVSLDREDVSFFGGGE